MKPDRWHAYLVWIAVAGAAGALVGWLHGRVHGAVVVGLTAPAFAALVPYHAGGLLEAVRLRRRPPLPPCARGRCSSYDVVLGSEEEPSLVCGCGDRYVRRGEQLRRLLRDGSTVPFRARDDDGRWRPAP